MCCTWQAQLLQLAHGKAQLLQLAHDQVTCAMTFVCMQMVEHPQLVIRMDYYLDVSGRSYPDSTSAECRLRLGLMLQSSTNSWHLVKWMRLVLSLLQIKAEWQAVGAMCCRECVCWRLYKRSCLCVAAADAGRRAPARNTKHDGGCGPGERLRGASSATCWVACAMSSNSTREAVCCIRNACFDCSNVLCHQRVLQSLGQTFRYYRNHRTSYRSELASDEPFDHQP
jgi:hypothetical protein